MKRHPSSIFYRPFSILLLVSWLFLSCDYKELCYDHNHLGDVNVGFDWQKESGTRVEGMTVLFYNQETPGEVPLRYDFVGMDGGLARLQPANYRTVAYNYDTETILYRGMDSDQTLEAYTRRSSIEEGTQMTRSGMPRAANTEEELVILEPDPLYGAPSESFMVEIDGHSSVVMTPQSRFEELTITIINVPNLEYTSQFGGALSGLAPSVWVQSGELGEGRVTQAFTCQVVGETTLQMHCRIFGHCPHRNEGQVNPHILTVYAILADNSKWFYSIDVTDLLHDQSQSPDDKNLEISVDGLPLPKPIVNGSGFQPTIDGWQGVEIDVTMGD